MYSFLIIVTACLGLLSLATSLALWREKYKTEAMRAAAVATGVGGPLFILIAALGYWDAFIR